MTTTRAAIEQASLSSYSDEDKAFYKFWYGHMLDDLMQPPLADINHSTARYIWDAAIADHDAEKKALEDELVRVREALEWIARVNAMDYEYVAKARAALSPTTTNKKES